MQFKSKITNYKPESNLSYYTISESRKDVIVAVTKVNLLERVECTRALKPGCLPSQKLEGGI